MIITGIIKIIELLTGKGDDNARRRRAGGVNAGAENNHQNAPAHPSDTKHYRKPSGNGQGIRGA